MDAVLALLSIIVTNAQQTGVSPELVLAIIETESAGNPYAARYVPTYPWTRMQANRPVNCTADTESAHQRTAWGLMQIMGGTARQVGFEGWLPELVDPETNIRIGIAYLGMLTAQHGGKHGLDGVISAYNAGAPRKTAEGKFQNQGYVSRVKKLMPKYAEILKGRDLKVEYGEDGEAAGTVALLEGTPGALPSTIEERADSSELGEVIVIAPTETTVSLAAKSKDELLELAKSLGLTVAARAKRDDIEAMLLKQLAAPEVLNA